MSPSLVSAMLSPVPSFGPSSPSLYSEPAQPGVGPGAGPGVGPASWTRPQVAQWLQRLLRPRLPPAEVQRVVTLLGPPGGAALLTLSSKEIAQRVGSDALAAVIHAALVDATKDAPAPDPALQPASPPSPGMFAEDLLEFALFSGADVYPQQAFPACAVPANAALQGYDHDNLALTELGSSQRVPQWIIPRNQDELPQHYVTAPLSPLAPMVEPEMSSYEDLLPPDHFSPLECRSSEFYWTCSAPLIRQTSNTNPGTFADLTSAGSDSDNQEVPVWGSPRTAFSPASSPHMITGMSPPSPSTAASPATPSRRGGRPRRPAGAPTPVRTRRRNGSGEATPGKGRLWQFILELLLDPDNQYESIIRWEDKQDGVFSFVDGHKAAELWGKRKHREKEMTYEKMSRTMRTYKNGAFASHPRRLFYKFGPKATWPGMRDVCPLRPCKARGC
ncbi:ETS homologous factor [Frankliniella fusca]|uniref:ETS homologous factor n=1 Tax=Frankliniella fusca TaxID=407009 RepID=A0AAE1LWP8_9NEOP|nr:ETS homologous factor [Frankliniella fusca]